MRLFEKLCKDKDFLGFTENHDPEIYQGIN